MAEFTLGLTKTVVEGAVSKVKSAIEEEKNLKEKVENDLVFITGEFEMMQSVLNVTNKERAKNKVLGTWVRQLRDLAFDVEDCVEFVVHLDNDNSTWWWSLLPSCVAPSRPLDEAATHIRQLKARVEDLSQRNTRYNLISDSGSDSKAITVVEQPTPATTNKSAFDVLCEATGKWRGVGDLEKLINSEGDDLQVISVWGNAGAHAELGTTPIFNKVYIDSGICQEFKTRAWVKLMTPFNPDEFRKSLLTQVCATSYKANDFCPRMKASVDMEDDLMQQFMGRLRYLVILEGVTTTAEWDVIKTYLPDSKNGSRIVMSTKQLQTALFCAGKPYQVSDFTQFTNHQSLLAFSKKPLRRHSGKGELIWQIRCRGVVSVWGTDTDGVKSTAIYKVYASIMYKSKQFEGVEFKRHSWVDVPYKIDSEEFDMEVLARRLLVHFRSEDLQVEAIAEVGKMRDPDLTRECCRFLREEDCLVVINGLRSTHDWDRIKAAFLSERIKGCVVVIANEESVATHCVDEEHAALSMKKHLEADPVLRPLIKCCRQLYGAGGNKTCRRGHVWSTRREEARNWDNIYYGVWRQVYGLRGHPAGVISLWGTAGAGKSTAVRNEYYEMMRDYDKEWELDYEEESQTDKGGYSMYSWVDVPHPFDEGVFFQLLFLDFHSYDLRAKESAAISMMEGQDPIQWCREILRKENCLVVIDDLRSTDDWDSIKKDINNGHVLVITNEEAVAKYCVDQDQNQVIKIEDFEPNPTLPALIKGCRYGRKEASSLFSNRREKARGWTVPTFKLLGRQSIAANALSDCIVFDHLDHDGSCVFSVWGISGVGKSAVVRNVYSHIMLGLSHQLKDENGEHGWGNYGKLYTMNSWVDVPHPLNLAELSSRMLLDFQSDNPQVKENTAVGIMEGQDPIQICRRIMCEEKCLIVIDGLQSKEDWDCIKAAFSPETAKSCIIVITNEASVARHCVDKMEERVVNVKCLEADAALSLFKKVSAKELMNSEEEKKLSTLIMAKCGGIPKVITILGEYLKSSEYSMRYALEIIKDDFMVKLETNPEFYKLSGLLFWMRRYFDACPDSLKPCIFYLPVFPIDQHFFIRRRRLVRRWIAEGYSRDTTGRTVEENGERLFSELVDLSIVQHQGSKGLWQVNGFFHEFIISRPMEDNHVIALEGHCSLNTQHAGQHLTIRESWDRDETVFGGIDFSRLRSLTVFGEWKAFMVSHKMRLVRVLDLENTSKEGECVTNVGLEHIVDVLPRLKFLSLRGCKEISRLPDSLGNLRQLQTLDVRKTSIVTLPPAIVKLQKMQYIRAGTWDGKTEDLHPTSTPPEGSDNTILAARDQVQKSTTKCGFVSWLSKLHGRCRLDNGGVAVPAGILNTTALHTLGVVNVSAAGGKAFLKELNNLTQLRKLGVCGINGENWKEFYSAISGHLPHLESLSLQLEKDNQGFLANLDDISEPPKTLKSLKLYGNVRILPAWIRQLEYLRKGNPELTILTQQDNDMFVDLPHQIVSIFRCLCVKPVEDGVLRVGRLLTTQGMYVDERFRFLVLEIDCTSSLHVQFVMGFLESIELLMVHCSSGSSLQISGLPSLKKLKEVCLQGSYSDELKQDLQRQISEHPNEPVLKEL